MYNFYMSAMPKNMLEVIAYHEGLPGHHMQIAIAQELTGVGQGLVGRRRAAAAQTGEKKRQGGGAHHRGNHRHQHVQQKWQLHPSRHKGRPNDSENQLTGTTDIE